MIREIKRKAANGIAVLLILLASIVMLVFFLFLGISGEDPVLIIGCIIFLVVVVFLLFGLFVVNPNEASLVGNIPEISERLRHENQERLAKAGVEVIESRISHLAYSPEIARAMLRRQQATAIIAARRTIVEGAVGMVEHALHELSAKGILELDEERKAAMVSNLLVVLCSESETQPVINTGSLYT